MARAGVCCAIALYGARDRRARGRRRGVVIENVGDDGEQDVASRRPLADPARRPTTPPTTTPRPGDGQENPRRSLPLALDGDPTTAWETERYDTPELGNIKDGVGVYLDAGRPVVARAIRIVDAEGGLALDLYVANNVPQTVADWTRVGGGEMDADPQDARPRHRRPALPLLPDLDHPADRERRAAATARRSRSCACCG